MKRHRCKYSSKVSAFADHELLLTEGSAMESHLRFCSDCQGELAEVTYVRDRLKLLKAPELPALSKMRVELAPVPAKTLLGGFFNRRITK